MKRLLALAVMLIALALPAGAIGSATDPNGGGAITTTCDFWHLGWTAFTGGGQYTYKWQCQWTNFTYSWVIVAVYG